jgi:dTDP-4-amino-4,6-dideoxygalactose transaminase
VPRVQTLNKPFLTFGKPDISEAEIQAVVNVMRSGWIGTGKVASEFERAFEEHMGSGNAVAVSSCSMGLILALKALGVGPGREVVTTPLTFAATINAIIHVGAKPVFVDVDEYGCMDADQIDSLNSYRIKALLPVHYTGAPCHMDNIMDIANRHGWRVIEDAAHSFGGEFRGMKQGSFGHASVFSFYATKNITSGEGGMVFTNDEDVAERVRILSQQGQSSGAWNRYSDAPIKDYEVVLPGYKGNFPDILAAIGLTQLKRWGEIQANRRVIWDVYAREYGRKAVGHSQHLYTILNPKRDELRAKLKEVGIGTGIHYEALHLQPAYKYLGYKKGDFPNAEEIGRTTLSLPISPTMTEEDAVRVISEIRNIEREM